MFAGRTFNARTDDPDPLTALNCQFAMYTDLSVNPKTGMVTVFMVHCPEPDQWAARDLFLKTATHVFKNIAP